MSLEALFRRDTPAQLGLVRAEQVTDALVTQLSGLVRLAFHNGTSFGRQLGADDPATVEQVFADRAAFYASYVATVFQQTLAVAASLPEGTTDKEKEL